MSKEHWSLDCHDTLMEVENTLESLKVRLIDDKDCPEVFAQRVYELEVMVKELCYDDELIKIAENYI